MGAKNKCIICGCTENDCRKCIELTGMPCWWHSEEVCSACAEFVKEGIRYAKNLRRSAEKAAKNIKRNKT